MTLQLKRFVGIWTALVLMAFSVAAACSNGVPLGPSDAATAATNPSTTTMYAFFGGDRVSKSAMVKAWVLAGAPQSR